MKKVITILLALVLCFSVFATNEQMIIPIDSPIAHNLNLLFTSQGLVDFPQSGPWSVGEIRSYLAKVDPQSEVDKALYDSIVATIDSKCENAPVIDLDLDLSLETYLHSNLNVKRDDWVTPFIEQKQPVSAKFNFFINDHIYLFTDVFFGNHYKLQRDFASKGIDTNLLIDIKDLNTAMPYRTFISVGGDNWNLLWGRDRFYFGSGITGSLLLGDNFPYQNALRFNFYKAGFKYTFFSSFYPHPNNYSNTDQNADFTGLFMYMFHRFEYAFFKNFSMTVSEGIIYQNEQGFIDLALYNPMALFHSFFIRNNANSILSVDFNYAPVKNMNLWLQVAVDEFGFGTSDELHNPNAVGILLGGRYTYDIKPVKAVTSLEFAYVDPYMYLRDCPTPQDPNNDRLDFIGAYREYTVDVGATYHKEFLGYKYGNDNIVVSLKQEFIHPTDFKAVAQFTYIGDGELNKETKWKEITDFVFAPSGKARHSMICSFSGEYALTDSLALYSKLDIPMQFAPEFKMDTQFTLGMSWKAF